MKVEERLAAFANELETIKTDYLKEFATRTISYLIEAENFRGAASSSGKYHPVSDLGKGGLVRHSRIVAKLVEIMIRSMPEYDIQENRDRVFISALLHDMAKFDNETAQTHEDHPLRMAAVVDKYIKRYKDELSFAQMLNLIKIKENISTHMSRWNTCKYDAKGTVMPLPTTQEQYLIVYADLIGSNKQFPEFIKELSEEAQATMEEKNEE